MGREGPDFPVYCNVLLCSLSLEVGYRGAMLDPALLATYLGDLPQEIFRVVSNADRVKAAWARCVALVDDPSLGEAGAEGRGKGFGELFDLLVSKWHNCRMFVFTNNLTRVRKSMKEQKAAMALRDLLKARAGGSEKKGEGKKKALSRLRGPPMLKRHVRGADAWKGLRVADLKAYIKECGRSHPSSYKKADLQGLLRSIAPGIGTDSDTEPMAEEGGTFQQEQRKTQVA